MLVYLAHPVRGEKRTDIDINLLMAKHWLRWAIDNHPTRTFIAPWIPECEVFNESDDSQRERALKRCLSVIGRCDEVWLCGPTISAGMYQEANHAHSLDIPVLDLTVAGCSTPPQDGQPFARIRWRAA